MRLNIVACFVLLFLCTCLVAEEPKRLELQGLIAGLQSPIQAKRQQCVLEVGEILNKQRLLQEKHPEKNFILPIECVPYITGMLGNDPSFEVRVECANVLGQFRFNAINVVPALIDAYREEHVPLQIACVRAMSKFHGESLHTYQFLVAASRHPDEDLRKAGEAALNRLKKRGVLPQK